MIAICIPTRGYLFTETVESVLSNLEWFKHKIYFTKDLPIPDCFNEVTERALKDRPTHIWYVEEDVVPPKNALECMMELNKDYVAIDYPILPGQGCIGFYNGKVNWTGLGCTLIKTEALLKLKKPYFQSKTFFIHKDKRVTFEETDIPSSYGGQDIYLGLKLNKIGITLTVLDGKCRHLKIKEKGSEGNSGCHTIIEKG
jgi:hypothetical protein